MYKSKLQELCHQRLWSLSEYSTTKDGLDHAPRFIATVTVNGLTFRNQEPSKSIKESQNQAAKVAFDHFTETPRSLGVGEAPLAESSSENMLMVQSGLPETYQISGVNDASSGAKDDAGLTDMRHLGKNQLQMYAQKRNLLLPTYSCEREGPPHATRFKCKVTIDGKTFESPDYFKSLKDAEHAAARVALKAISSDELHENDNGLYKNLLQEITQKKGYRLPLYETSRLAGHIPYFISTVEVEGERFTGEQKRSKNLAEMNAAKTTYMILTNRKQGRSTTVQYSYQQQAFSSPNKSQPYVDPAIHHTVNPAAWPLANSTQKENIEEALAKMNFHVPSPAAEVSSVKKEDHTLTDMAYDQLRDPFPSSLSPEVGSSSSKTPYENGNLVTESNTQTPDNMDYSADNVVRVYPRAPNQTFPEGTVAFSEENWVAVTVKGGPYVAD